MTFLEFHVIGTPKPQGSKKAFMAGGAARMRESAGEPLKDWRRAVGEAAQEARQNAGLDPLDGPVAVGLEFLLAKPKTAKAWKVWADRMPDIDKLARATLDGLTAGQVFTDDSRVVALHTTKRYAIGVSTGCRVILRCLSDEERTGGPLMESLRSTGASAEVIAAAEDALVKMRAREERARQRELDVTSGIGA